MPYIIIISLTAILLIILQLLNIKVFKHDKVKRN